MIRRAVAVVLAAFTAAAPAAQPPAEPIPGFTPESSATQRALEARFDAGLDAGRIRAAQERLAARPHHLGSPYGKANAEWMRDQLASFGFEARLEEYRVLFPTPKLRRLEMTAPTRFVASLTEPALAEDRTSGQKDEQLPPYNAYSVDGDVEAELVYVNYGVPKDYEELARRGVDVKGKIVLARYGGAWRGTKPKVAAENGAIGCIIFSDPADDGYRQGHVYPKDGWRSADSVQRGSVADMPIHSGDPLTPGVGATADAKRLDRKDAATLTKIPVLPISYGDARPLLAALGGPVAPAGWAGALPVPYHLGPGPAKVRLKVEFDWKLAPAYDVVAVLRGSERPDEWVLRGNHHDAWVNGASDPVSGMAALLEEARAIGQLAKGGSRPKRTLVYAGWDGEEQGLLGSTEFAETHAAELREKAVAYINTDSNGRGFVSLAGSHTLEKLVNSVAREVEDPERKVSILERARSRTLVTGGKDERKEARERADLRLHALGSGSDYTPFLQHLGIAALHVGFGGEERYGQYHSAYDSLDHFRRFVDPDMAYGVTCAKTAGRIALRLANADSLPFHLGTLAEAVESYATDVEKLAADMREETAETNRLIAEKRYEAADDPTEVWVTPAPKTPVPHLNFAPLRNAAARLTESAKRFDAMPRTGLTPEAARALDRKLMALERTLTLPGGLPGRPWYRHQVYAPGRYTGYGVKTLPAVREAIELREFPEAEKQILVVSGVIEGCAKAIDEAAALLAPTVSATGGK